MNNLYKHIIMDVSALTKNLHSEKALRQAAESLGEDYMEKQPENISVIPPAPISRETLAVECIRDLGKAYKLSFKISYNQKQNRWSVNVMSHTFNNWDFCEAVSQAIQFVLKAKDVKLDNTKSE